MDHSEVKHLPKVDHTPADLDEPAKLLLKAADVIDRQGWCQNYIGTRGGQVCLEGALMVAYGREPASIIEYHPIALEALNRVRAAVGQRAFEWNDQPGRKKGEVTAKLRSVALGL